MKKSIFCLSLLLIVLTSNLLPGQGSSVNEGNTDSYTFHLRVQSSDDLTIIDDQYFGYISIPFWGMTIKPGTNGPVSEIYSDFSKDIQVIGRYEVLRFEEDYWYGKYNLNDYGKKINDEMGPADCMVEIEVEIPSMSYRSIFFEMFRNGVEFTDVFDEPLYSLSEILEKDSEQLEQLLLIDLLDDIKFTAVEMRKSMDSPIIEGGRYHGDDLFSAMEKSSVMDVRSFLRYVKQKPLKYRGGAWKISETYATWLVSESPVSGVDLIELLSDSYQNDELFYFYVSDTENNILSNWLPEWRLMGESKHDMDQTITGRKILEACGKVAYLVENMEEGGWSYFSLAQTYSDDEALEAEKYYSLALEFFELANEKAGILAAQNNLGYVYNDLEEYQKAQEILEKAYALELEVIPDPKSRTAATVALTLRNLGNSYLGQKKYKKALSIYEEGLKFANQNQTLSLKRKAALYFQIAETYQDMGKDEDYEFYTELAVSTYQEYEELSKKNKKL